MDDTRSFRRLIVLLAILVGIGGVVYASEKNLKTALSDYFASRSSQSLPAPHNIDALNLVRDIPLVELSDSTLPPQSDLFESPELVEDPIQEEPEEVQEPPQESIPEETEPIQKTPPPAQTVVKEVLPPLSEINTKTRSALVNIICTTKSGGLFRPSSGSGIIVDERGLILTNAHVAQYYLLEDYISEDFFDCIIRTGSPAEAMYRAELLYISEQWVKDNAFKITESNPLGNGQDDFAFLLITERSDTTESLPKTFPFISLNKSAIAQRDDTVLIAGYPAGFLSGLSIQKDLFQTSTITNVTDVFTFTQDVIDLITLGGVIVAQGGSSGSPVVNTRGDLAGLVVTSTDGDTTADRNLAAITTEHINRSLVEQTGATIPELFERDLIDQVDLFAREISPALTALLELELEK